uniref:Uncharacterized protein n=1 Tax=Arundo donax TaxID=35708 RepID=A0A0A9AF05_ARUDO
MGFRFASSSFTWNRSDYVFLLKFLGSCNFIERDARHQHLDVVTMESCVSRSSGWTGKCICMPPHEGGRKCACEGRREFELRILVGQ